MIANQEFTPDEQEWFNFKPVLKKDLFAEFEDFTNVNPLDNGERDTRFHKIGISGISAVIAAHKENLIEGPYNSEHFQCIKEYFPCFNIDESKFWKLFSGECASKKQEGRFTKARLYMAALCNISVLKEIEGIDLNDVGNADKVYDMNSGKPVTLKDKGVAARF